MTKLISKNSWGNILKLLPYLIITLVFVVIPLVLIFQKSFTPTTDSITGQTIPVEDNWNFIGLNIFEKIGLSIGIAIACTALCAIVGYVFAYFLSLSQKTYLKIIAIALITSPMWISMMIKLVGLKTLFDFINGAPNSTYGHIYTILALSYINLPVFILTIYAFLNSIPKNLLQASKDLGKSALQTFFHVIIPYTKNAIFSGLALVFFPSLTSAGVAQFVNNSNDGATIGGDILNQGLEGSTSQIALARVSSVSLVMCLIIILIWSFSVLIPRAIKAHKKNKKLLLKGESNV